MERGFQSFLLLLLQSGVRDKMPTYVVAGGTTINMQVYDLIQKGYATYDSFKKFVDDTTNLYLTSIGEVLSKKDTVFDVEKTLKKAKKLFTKTYFDSSSVMRYANVKPVIDSGGYQISVGYINKNDINKFFDYYKAFLEWIKPENVSYVFSLDIIGDVPTFSHPKEIEEWNKRIINRMLNELPDGYIPDKLWFVYHFIHRNLEPLWWKLLQPHFHKFRHFAVGGLVAFQRVNTLIPIYAIPLLKIAFYKKLNNLLDDFTFHILGVSPAPEIFNFVVIETLLNHLQIPIRITFDSTSAIREVTIGKVIRYMTKDGKAYAIPYGYKDILKKHPTLKKTPLEVIQEIVDDFNRLYGFKIPVPNQISDIFPDGIKSAPNPYYERIFILQHIRFNQYICKYYQPIMQEIIQQDLYDKNPEKFELLINQFITNVSLKGHTRSVIDKIKSIKRLIQFVRSNPTIEDIDELHRRSFKVTKYKLFDMLTESQPTVNGGDLCF